MPSYPSDRPSACCPYLFYDDVERAIGFLTEAFGLVERFVDRAEGGPVHHAQLAHGTAVIMLGETGAHAGYRARKSPAAAGSLNAGVYLFVADIEAHAQRARAAGAKIVMAPTDMHWGERLYCAEDPEGLPRKKPRAKTPTTLTGPFLARIRSRDAVRPFAFVLPERTSDAIGDGQRAGARHSRVRFVTPLRLRKKL